MSSRLVVLAAILLALAAAPIEAATVYVCAATGDDGRNYATAQNASTPWDTIGRAAWGTTNRASQNAGLAAQTGDTVSVCAGTYDYDGVLSDRWEVVYNPANAGVTFVATGAVILTAPTTQSPVIGCSSRNNTIWQGPFTLDEATISISADTGSTVLHNATGCGLDGVIIDGNGMPNGDDDPPFYNDNHNGVRIEVCTNCFVKNATIHDVRNTSDNHNGAAIMLYNSDGTVIEHNSIYDVDNAVFIKGVFGVEDPQSGTIIRFNLLVDCDECITVSDSRDARIYQNVIRDGDAAVNLLAREPEEWYHPVGDWFVNNTVDNMTLSCIQINGGAWHEDVRIWNNLMTNCGPVANYREEIAFPNSSANVINWEHNGYHTFTNFANDSNPGSINFATWIGATYSQDAASPAGTSTTDPLFADASGNDFRLCTGTGTPVAGCAGASPLLAQGVDILDLDGDLSTSDNIPSGAFVTNNETIGPESEQEESSTKYRFPRVSPADLFAALYWLRALSLN